MDAEGVARIATWLGKKSVSLISFSLVGAQIDKDNKRALEESLVKNKTIQELSLSSNGLALPGILRATKKAMKSLSRLTSLDLSFNSLPVQGAKALAKFLEHANCSLETLILSNNHLTTKGANHILPALKANESLEELDLRYNLRGIPMETVRRINALDGPEGLKIRYKVVLALTNEKLNLYDPCGFNDVPLELMPRLLNLLQQEIGCDGFGADIVASSSMTNDRPFRKRKWNRETRSQEYFSDPTLARLYEVIMAWQSLPLLFVNGAGKLPEKKEAKPPKKRKKRRRFGDEDDDDDEPYIPKGGRKRGRWVHQPVADGSRYFELVRIPPPVY
ncbi:hypothetical protein ACHAXT_008309 [Thalassiosira profunda]